MNQVKVSYHEMVQVIQNLKNDTRMVPGKPAVLRVYLEDPELGSDAELSASLEISDPSSGSQARTLDAQVRLLANGSSEIEAQRRRYHSSLNFKIPGSLVKKSMKLTLTVNGSGIIDTDLVPEFAENEITLNVRTVGIRFCDDISGLLGLKKPKNTGRSGLKKTYQPDNLSIHGFESLAKRCLPVSTLNFSHITIDAPRHFKPPFPIFPTNHETHEKRDRLQIAHLATLHAFLMAVRSMDVECGCYDDTYYYGMLDGPIGDLRGAVSDVPLQEDPQFAGNVAVGLADTGGDYGVHELCHLLGRLHPGDPPANNDDTVLKDAKKNLRKKSSSAESADKKTIIKDILKRKRNDIYTQQEDEDTTPYIIGSLNDPVDNSTAGKESIENKEIQRFVGLDIDDTTHSVRVKHYRDYADIMTYRYNLWISNYTYSGLMDKLSREFVSPVTASGSGTVIRVIGQYPKQSESDYNLLYVLPVTKLLPATHHVKDYANSSSKTEVELEVKFQDDPKTYYVEVERRRKPKYIDKGTLVDKDPLSDWGVFQLDLKPKDGKVFESIKLYGHEYKKLVFEAPDPGVALANLKVELCAFNNDDGFKIRITGMPTACRFVVAVKNSGEESAWQTVAVESIQENADRKDADIENTEVYIDKQAIEHNPSTGIHEEWSELNVKVKLVCGFEHQEKDFILSQ